MSPRPWAERLAAAAAGLLLVSGCTSNPADDPAAPRESGAEATPTATESLTESGTDSATGSETASPTDSPSGSETGSETASPSASPAGSEEALPPVRHRVSLPALMRREPDGGRPRILTTERYDGYTRHEVIYRSGDLRVSGVLFRPTGPGPFPGIVLNHGYIEPSIYVTGQGLRREQIALAQAGFVVLHTDYRGHAAGDPVSDLERESRVGYAYDAINAVDALTKLPYVNDKRLAMLGRSMGGGVTMNALVAQPGLVDAAVIYASVSSRYLDNLRHFTFPNRPEAAREVFGRYGTPQQNPRFYRDLSARTFFGRITEPVLSHHGVVDRTCPPRWAQETQRAMRRAGVDSQLFWYPGEDHTFYARWQQSMNRTIQFLRQQFRR